ncbi:unnamed protein product [Arabidopsis halleri]
MYMNMMMSFGHFGHVRQIKASKRTIISPIKKIKNK